MIWRGEISVSLDGDAVGDDVALKFRSSELRNKAYNYTLCETNLLSSTSILGGGFFTLAFFTFIVLKSGFLIASSKRRSYPPLFLQQFVDQMRMSHPGSWGGFVLITKAEETIDRNLSPSGWWDKLLFATGFYIAGYC